MRLWFNQAKSKENPQHDSHAYNWYDLIPEVPIPPQEYPQSEGSNETSDLIDQILQQKENEELDHNLELKIEIIERKRMLLKQVQTFDRLICHTNNLLSNRGVPISPNAWLQRRTELEKSLLHLIQEKLQAYIIFRQETFKITQSASEPKNSFASASNSKIPSPSKQIKTPINKRVSNGNEKQGRSPQNRPAEGGPI